MKEGYVEAVNAHWRLVAIRLHDTGTYCVARLAGADQLPAIGQCVRGELEGSRRECLVDEQGDIFEIVVLRPRCGRAEAFRLTDGNMN